MRVFIIWLLCAGVCWGDNIDCKFGAIPLITKKTENSTEWYCVPPSMDYLQQEIKELQSHFELLAKAVQAEKYQIDVITEYLKNDPNFTPKDHR